MESPGHRETLTSPVVDCIAEASQDGRGVGKGVRLWTAGGGLDRHCGSGRSAASSGGFVVASDVSAGWLDASRERAIGRLGRRKRQAKGWPFGSG